MADLLTAFRQFGTIQNAALVHNHLGNSGNTLRGNLECYQDCPIYRVPCYGRLLYAPLSPLFPRWLDRAIQDFRPQLLHIHMPNTSAFWCLASQRAKALPWLVHWHADVVASRLDKRLALAYRAYRPFEQRLLAHSSSIIATSPPYLAASTALATWRDRVKVVPLGISLPAPPLTATAQAQAEQLWGNGNASSRILNIGRLTYYKGHEVLLDAVAQCPNVCLLIAGSGERKKQLSAQIQRLGLSERVRLLGYTEQPLLNALLASCDMFCLPSLERTEAFGVVLLEAMRYGKPIITSAIEDSGPAWVVQSSGAGETVIPAQVVPLAATIQRLANNPEQRIHYGMNGLNALQRDFSIDQVARQIAALYAELITDSAKTTNIPLAV